jgi:hypothetical protein
MRRRGFGEGAILAALLEENRLRCDPPLPDDEVGRVAASIGKRAPAADAASEGEAVSAKLTVVDVCDFLKMEIPPREYMLSPWLLCQSTNMIYAPHGTGKTLLGLSLAYAIASGGELFGWKASRPRRVLYLDGEMLAASLQERLTAIVAGADLEPEPGMLKIVTPDLQEGFMPNLGTVGGQAVISEAIDAHGAELTIVDSLSSLLRTEASENDDVSWGPVAHWALQQRVKRRSLIFFHHANRQGGQRGTSKREDILDTVLALRPGAEHEANKQARFEIHIEKSRALCEKFVPIEAELTLGQDGQAVWVSKPLALSLRDRMLRMLEDGMKKSEIAEELRVARSYVYKVASEAKK